ncbi:MAG: caspase family protein [Spirochaetales bacterium]|nr:caspase family protein [Spirochaetales bacterium]
MENTYKFQGTGAFLKLMLWFGLIGLLPVLHCAADDKVYLQIDPGGHTSEITDIVVTSDKKYAVTGSLDKTIRVWDLDGKKEIRKLSGDIGSANIGKVNAIALSPDDTCLAAGGELGGKGSEAAGSIRIYDFQSGEIMQRLPVLKTPVTDIAFSSDGRYLCASDEEGTIAVWKFGRNFTFFHSYKVHEKRVHSIALFDNNGAPSVVSGGADGVINIYSLAENKIVGTRDYSGDPVQSVSVNETRKWIIVGRAGAARNTTATGYLYDYSLKPIVFFRVEGGNEPNTIVSSPDGNYILCSGNSEKNRVSLNQYAEKKGEYIRVNAVMQFPELEGDIGACVFVDNTKAILAGGRTNEIYIWDIKRGREEKISSGSPEIRALGIKENRVFISYQKPIGKTRYSAAFQLDNFTLSNDAALFPVDEIQGISHSFNEYSVYMNSLKKNKNTYAEVDLPYDYNDLYPKGFTNKGDLVFGGPDGQLGVYNKYGKKYADLLGHTGTIYSLAMNNNVLISGGEDRMINFWNLNELENGTEALSPYLSLFLSPEGEWVVWSKNGYYISSVNGDSLIYYHINRGIDKKADHYDFEQFYKTYYRPDIIEKIIKGQSVEKGLESVSSLAPNFSSDTTLPPEIVFSDISSRSIQTPKNEITIHYQVRANSQTPVDSVTILVNGRKFTTNEMTGPSLKTINATVQIPLDRQTTIVTISAKNKFAVSKPSQLVIFRNSDIQEEKLPKLHILSVGISSYKNASLNLTFADKDAESMSMLFENQKGKLYSEVERKVLTNTHATKKAILKELSVISRKASKDDSVILFLAGHGVNDSAGNYYFLSWDADPARLAATAIPWSDFKNELLGLSARVLFIVDTCHSGNVWGTSSMSKNALVGAVKSISSEGSGTIIMTGATTDDSSFENAEWGHGAFTFSMLEAIGDKKADFDNDDTITLKEFDLYISMRVKNMTKGSQRPTTIIPQSIPDYPIARMK